MPEPLIEENMKVLLNKIIKEEDKIFKGKLLQVLYSMIGQLNKRYSYPATSENKSENNEKGFRKDGTLWILTLHTILTQLLKDNKEIAEQEKKRIKAVEEAEKILSTRKKIEDTLKEFKKSIKNKEGDVDISKKKRRASEIIEDAAKSEKIERLTTLRNMTLSFEKLLLNLAVFCFSKDDDVYGSIKELKACFKNVYFLCIDIYLVGYNWPSDCY